MIVVPQVVQNEARALGANDWLESLPDLVKTIESQWSLKVGSPFSGATEAFVAEATMADGQQAVLKLVIPRSRPVVRNEVTALRLADGQACVALLRSDIGRGALLLERLGRSMSELGLPLTRRHEILCDLAQRVWCPAIGSGLPTGAEKAEWLRDIIVDTWEELDRPCSERAVIYAVECAERRRAAHRDERAVLVHGDVHQWNALEAGSRFKLIDPDGLLAEPEYDLGVIIREDPVELLQGEPYERAQWLAQRTGLDEVAIWEWGVVERVANGLLLLKIDLQPVADQMLRAAEGVAQQYAT